MSKSETQISKEKAGAVASRSKFVLKTLDFEPSFIDGDFVDQLNTGPRGELGNN
jgi:hypothetical protein